MRRFVTPCDDTVTLVLRPLYIVIAYDAVARAETSLGRRVDGCARRARVAWAGGAHRRLICGRVHLQPTCDSRSCCPRQQVLLRPLRPGRPGAAGLLKVLAPPPRAAVLRDSSDSSAFSQWITSAPDFALLCAAAPKMRLGVGGGRHQHAEVPRFLIEKRLEKSGPERMPLSCAARCAFHATFVAVARRA